LECCAHQILFPTNVQAISSFHSTCCPQSLCGRGITTWYPISSILFRAKQKRRVNYYAWACHICGSLSGSCVVYSESHINYKNNGGLGFLMSDFIGNNNY
jgi:hypothetical protein